MNPLYVVLVILILLAAITQHPTIVWLPLLWLMFIIWLERKK